MFEIKTIEIVEVRIKYNDDIKENMKLFLVLCFILLLFIILHIKNIIIGSNKYDIHIIITACFE